MVPRRLSLGSDTCYPKLDLDDAQSGEDDVCVDEELLYAESSSNNANVNDVGSNLKARHWAKEDEDVEMFIAIVEQMSVHSILFLLQNYAREMLNIPEKELKQALLVETHTRSGRNLFTGEFDKYLHVPKPIKKFRFAEIMGGSQIRVQLFEHLHVCDITEEEKADAWWTYEEMGRMKRNAGRIVRHYKLHRPDFVILCEQLAQDCSKVNPLEQERHHAEMERQIKSFAKEGAPARGLELHICDALAYRRYQTIGAVLDRQDFIYDKRNLLGKPVTPESIARDWDSVSQVYIQANQASAQMAFKFAQADHMQAFKAILSKWTKPVELEEEKKCAEPSPIRTQQTPPAQQVVHQVSAPPLVDISSQAKGCSVA